MPQPQKSYRCRICGRELYAWLVAAKRPNGAMLLYRLGDMHPDQVRPYEEPSPLHAGPGR